MFLALVLATVAAAAVTWGSDQASRNWKVFAFVLLGWIVSLCVHEFAHAITAYRYGDRSIADKGYLTLDPRKYVSPGLSILLPLAFLIMGGIGLPGGAVWIQMGAIRQKWQRSVVSAAGPVSNLIIGVLLCLPFRFAPSILVDAPVFSAALAFLALLQFIAAILNALPIPGLDGFGVLEPHLPRSFLEAIAPWRQYTMVVLFVLAWRAPWFGNLVFDNAHRLLQLVSGEKDLSIISEIGAVLFRFWER